MVSFSLYMGDQWLSRQDFSSWSSIIYVLWFKEVTTQVCETTEVVCLYVILALAAKRQLSAADSLSKSCQKWSIIYGFLSPDFFAGFQQCSACHECLLLYSPCSNAVLKLLRLGWEMKRLYIINRHLFLPLRHCRPIHGHGL